MPGNQATAGQLVEGFSGGRALLDWGSPWSGACSDRLLNREHFTGQRVGTILCGSNVSTDDCARWVLGNG
jgi:hypothetical protein